MNISELIKEAHENAIERGFYDLCDCNEGNGYNCSLCNNETGVIQNKNIGELLMLIVSELGEALEAHRCGQFADWDLYIRLTSSGQENLDDISIFEDQIKDTFEDEIADVFIRLFDLCGYLIPSDVIEHLQIIVNQKNTSYQNGIKNIGQWLFSITIQLGEISHMCHKDIIPLGSIGIVLMNLKKGCEILNIPIEKHIKAKMAYNRTRPHKHGKEY